MCNCYYYDRAVHISVVAVDIRTLLDRYFEFQNQWPGGSTSSDWAYYQKAGGIYDWARCIMRE